MFFSERVAQRLKSKPSRASNNRGFVVWYWGRGTSYASSTNSLHVHVKLGCGNSFKNYGASKLLAIWHVWSCICPNFPQCYYSVVWLPAKTTLRESSTICCFLSWEWHCIIPTFYSNTNGLGLAKGCLVWLTLHHSVNDIWEAIETMLAMSLRFRSPLRTVDAFLCCGLRNQQQRFRFSQA